MVASGVPPSRWSPATLAPHTARKLHTAGGVVAPSGRVSWSPASCARACGHPSCWSAVAWTSHTRPYDPRGNASREVPKTYPPTSLLRWKVSPLGAPRRHYTALPRCLEHTTRGCRVAWHESASPVEGGYAEVTLVCSRRTRVMSFAREVCDNAQQRTPAIGTLSKRAIGNRLERH